MLLHVPSQLNTVSATTHQLVKICVPSSTTGDVTILMKYIQRKQNNQSFCNTWLTLIVCLLDKFCSMYLRICNFLPFYFIKAGVLKIARAVLQKEWRTYSVLQCHWSKFVRANPNSLDAGIGKDCREKSSNIPGSDSYRSEGR
jgi:hypothetical protein